MNPNTPDSSPPATVEAGLQSLLEDAKTKVSERYHDCEKYVRKSPGKAVMIAVAAGYLLHRLPIRHLFVTQARILAALAPPALVAFGAAKCCEVLQKQARK